MPITVAKPSTVRSEIARAIRKAIAQGELAPGERLNERTICEEIGVSRTSLREAIRQLETEGFIVSLPHRGAIVAEPDYKEIRDIYEVRSSLEALAAGCFAERADEKQKRGLSELFDKYEAAVTEDDLEMQVETKRQYYDFLFAHCGNMTAARLAGVLVDRVGPLRSKSLGMVGRSQIALDELRMLTEHVSNSRKRKAEEAARHHVEAAFKSLCLALQWKR